VGHVVCTEEKQNTYKFLAGKPEGIRPHLEELSVDGRIMLKPVLQKYDVCRRLMIDNSTFERVEEFKYLGTTLTNQNSIAEEIKCSLRSGNACYHSVQNLLSSRLLSKNLKIKIFRTTILPVFCMGVKLGR